MRPVSSTGCSWAAGISHLVFGWPAKVDLPIAGDVCDFGRESRLTKLDRVARAVGINHVALEVGDLDEAIAFWQRLFGPLELRGRGPAMAFIDLGDQFVALEQGRSQPPDRGRHLGLVVDDKE